CAGDVADVTGAAADDAPCASPPVVPFAACEKKYVRPPIACATLLAEGFAHAGSVAEAAVGSTAVGTASSTAGTASSTAALVWTAAAAGSAVPVSSARSVNSAFVPF